MSDHLPCGWSEQLVQDAFEIGRGRVISKPEIAENPGIFPVYSSQSTNQGKMGAINTYDFDGEYITWTTDGAYAGTVFYRNGRFNCTNVCGTLRAKEGQLLSLKFVAYFLSTVAKNHVSYVGNPKLMNGTFAEIPFLSPPIEEQQKIASILTAVDEVIESTQAQINKLKDLKTGMMQELLTKGIGHTEFKDSPVGRIPKAWEIKKLEDVAIHKGMQTGPFGSQLHSHEYVDRGIPVVMPKDLKNQSIDTSTIAKISQEKSLELKRHKLKVGDILFSRRGDIGRCAIVKRENEGWICGTGCLKVRLDKAIVPEFLIFYLSLTSVVEWLNNNAVGQTMLNLNTSILAETPVILPPLSEQKKIADSMTTLLLATESREKRLSQLTKLKSALMQDLLTGKVRVRAM